MTYHQCPGMGLLVEFLNDNGFCTTDAGYGEEFAPTQYCGAAYANIHILVEDRWDLLSESNRLKSLLEAEGISFPKPSEGDIGSAARIEAHYRPSDGYAGIELLMVDDQTLWEPYNPGSSIKRKRKHT